MNLPLPTEPLIDRGCGQPVILLHGLFGSLGNWKSVVEEFESTHRVIVPRLPLYSKPLSRERLDDLVNYLKFFVDQHSLEQVILIGNSVGGHIAVLFAWRYPLKIDRLILSGSSSLFENSFDSTYPRVSDDGYIREKTDEIPHVKDIITKALVDEVFEGLQNRLKIWRMITRACAAQQHSVSDILNQIMMPTLLIWGLQDTITPPEVALDFHDRLPRSMVAFIDKCGHVPMMEQPVIFNRHVRDFLS